MSAKNNRVFADIPLNAGAIGLAEPQIIVIHAMGEYIDTPLRDYHAIEYLRNAGLSAHIFVTPTGVIIRSRADDEGAYHARGHNEFSLSIEFLVAGLHTYETFLEAIKQEYVTPEQWRAGVEIVKMWRRKYDIGLIYRHSDIDPGRKHDPGDGFRWEQFCKDTQPV